MIVKKLLNINQITV